MAATSPQSGARTLRILQENSIDFITGAGEENHSTYRGLNPFDPHLSYHLTFPLLSVGAVGDEGDPVWLCYPTILPELVKEWTE